MSKLDRNKVQLPRIQRPHLFILGAGASYAAFPKGDKKGIRLPLMYNIVDVVGLRPILQKAGISYNNENFETLYSGLVAGGQHPECVAEMESAIFDYFAQMELPDEPTLYDHLVLSLRPKDVIATFNWDPFLIQAVARNYPAGGGPRLIFLHGNTAVGYCLEHQPATIGIRGNRCAKCGKPLIDSRLLYPIAQKNYNKDPSISLSWKDLENHLANAFMLTIFGYGAPASDVEAVTLMKQAWGAVETRRFEETEIIDIKTEDELQQVWNPFIHTHHYRTSTSFYESWTALHPRRSVDAMFAQVIDAEFIDQNPLPIHANWTDLRQFFKPLTDDEISYKPTAS
jgi:hypothetical protein